MIRLLMLFILVIGSALEASETDPFTLRYTSAEDATESINAEINRRIQKALSSIHLSERRLQRRMVKRRKACSPRRLNKALKRNLRRALYGQIDGVINRADAGVPVLYTPRRETIYADIRFRQAFPIFLGKLGLGNVVRIGDLLIGPDKFGHFMDEGYHYYKKRKKELSKHDVSQLKGSRVAYEVDMAAIHKSMKYGTKTENGFFGLKTTGVRSYGDMVANFNGLIFWSEVFDMPLAFRSAEEHRPYFECVDSNFIQVRQFDLRDYFDAGFDEGINCSEYREGRFRDSIMSKIAELESESGRRHTCPIIPDKCPALVEKYGEFAATIIHPTCLATR